MKMWLNLTLTLILLSSCGLRGTGTGNPEIPTSSMAPATASIFQVTCSRIETCWPGQASAANCGNAIVDLTTFAPKLGITAQPAPTVGEILVQDATGQITENADALRLCYDEIAAINCSSTEMHSAYAPQSTTPYAAAAGILPADCAGVYGSH